MRKKIIFIMLFALGMGAEGWGQPIERDCSTTSSNIPFLARPYIKERYEECSGYANTLTAVDTSEVTWYTDYVKNVYSSGCIVSISVSYTWFRSRSNSGQYQSFSTNSEITVDSDDDIGYYYYVTARVKATYRCNLCSFAECQQNCNYTSPVSFHKAFKSFNGGTISVNNSSIDASFCYNSSVTITSASLSNYSNASYSWQRSLTGNDGTWNTLGGATESYLANASLTTTQFYRRVASFSCNNIGLIAYSNTVKVNVYPQVSAGTISLQDGNSSGSFCANDNVLIIQGTAQNDAPSGGFGYFTYQWQRKVGSNWVNISTNATSIGYTALPATATETYRRATTNTHCNQTAYTNEVTIDRYAAVNPGILSVPGNNTLICRYGQLPLIITGTSASGGSGTNNYTWEYNVNEGSNSVLDEQTGPNYTITLAFLNFVVSSVGGVANIEKIIFFRKVTNLCGNATTSIQLSFNPLLAGSIKQNQIIPYASVPATIENDVLASGGGGGTITYSWQRSTTGTGDWTTISGATGNQLSTLGTHISSQFYKRIATVSGCGSEESNIIEIEVLLQLNGGVIAFSTGGNNTFFCINSANFQINNTEQASGGSGVYDYRWQQSINEGVSWTNIGGVTGLTYNPPSNLVTNVRYRRMCTDRNYPSSIAYSNVVFANVYAPLSGGEISYSEGDGNICNDRIPNFVNIKLPEGGNGSYSYQWQKSSTGETGNWQTISEQSDPNYQFTTALETSMFYRRLAINNFCNSQAPSNVLKLTHCISGGTITTTTGNEFSICDNTVPPLISSSTLPTGGNGNYLYQWEEGWTDGEGEITFTNILGATFPNYTPIAVLTHNSALPVKVYRRKCNDTDNVTGYSNEIRINVYAPVDGGNIGTDAAICAGMGFTIPNETSPSGGTGTFTYEWEQAPTASGIWVTISGFTADTYTFSSLASTTYFRRKATSTNSCGIAYSNIIKIDPALAFTGGTISGNQTICFGKVPEIILNSAVATGGVGRITYSWEKKVSGMENWIPTVSGGTAREPIDFEEEDNLFETTYYRRKASSSCGIVYSNEITVTVTRELNPGTITTEGGNSISICYGSSPQLICLPAIEGSGNYYYQWQEYILDKDSGLYVWANIEGQTNMTYIPPSLTESIKFRRICNDGCETVYSNEVSIVLYQSILPGLITINNGTMCHGAHSNSILNQRLPSGGNGPFRYFWQQSSTGTGGWTTIPEEEEAIYSPGEIFGTTYFRRGEINECSTVYSNTVQVTAAPQLLPGQIGPNEITTCFKGVPSMNITSSVFATGGIGTIYYSWEKSLDGINYVSLNNAGVGGGGGGVTTPGFVLADESFLETTYYRRTATNECGTVTSNAVKVTVFEDLQPGTITTVSGNNYWICHGASPSAMFEEYPTTGGSGNYTYYWQRTNDDIVWTNITGQTGTTYSFPAAITATTKYRRVCDDRCGVTYSNEITVNTYSPVVAGEIGYDDYICYDYVANMLENVQSPQGGDENFTYHWESSNTGSGNWDTIPDAKSRVYYPGALQYTTYYRRKEMNMCGDKISNIVEINVAPEFLPGVIAPHNQTICYNTKPARITSTTLSQGGIGPISYTWHQFYDEDEGHYILENETNSFLDPDVLTRTTNYIRVATNDCGDVFSNEIRVTVREELLPGFISTSDGNDFWICYADIPPTLTSSSIATGGSEYKSYQWQQSVGSNGDNWTNLVGYTQLNYSPPDPLFITTKFRRACIDLSCGTVYSNVIVVNVYRNVENGIIEGSQSICYGEIPAEIRSINSPSGGSGTFIYEWEQSPTGTGNWTTVQDATSMTYSPGNLTQTTYYRRKEINSCGIVNSNIIQITVHPQLVAGGIKINQTICYDAIPSMIESEDPASGGFGSLLYSWEKSTNGITGWQTIEGASNLYFNFSVGLQETTHFRRKVNNDCGVGYSNIIVITVYQQYKPGVISGNQTIDYGTQPSTLTTIEEPSGGSGNRNIIWQIYINDNWNDISAAFGNTYQPTNLTVTTRYRKKITDNDCGIIYTNVVIVTVYPNLLSGSIAENQSICFSTVPEKLRSVDDASGGDGTIIYRWQRSSNGFENWVNIENAHESSYTSGKLETTTFFRRIAESGTLTRNSNPVQITVFPEMITPVHSSSGIVCKGDNRNITINNLQPSYKYYWYNENDSYIHEGNNYQIDNIQNDIVMKIKSVHTVNDCESDLSIVQITVDQIKANFTPQNTTVREGSQVQFSSTSEYANAYLWNFSFGELSTNSNPYVYYNEIGIYQTILKVTSVNGCQDEKIIENCITVIPVIRIDEENPLHEEKEISIYPNPNTGNFFVVSSNINKIEIYDIVGRIINFEILSTEKDFNYEKLEISVKGIAAGIYFINVVTDNKRTVSKLIVE